MLMPVRQEHTYSSHMTFLLRAGRSIYNLILVALIVWIAWRDKHKAVRMLIGHVCCHILTQHRHK